MNLCKIMMHMVPQALCFLTGTVSPAGAQTPNALVKAYSFYLLQQYDSACIYYRKAALDDTASLEPVYGLMNCHSARGEYGTALEIGNHALARYPNDYFLLLKTAYAYAATGNKGIVRTLYGRVLNSIQNNGDSAAANQCHADFISAAGYGFHYRADYHEALRWFRAGDSLFANDQRFSEGIRIASNAQKNLRSLQAACSGGYIGYSRDILFTESGYPYRYAGGRFLSAGCGYLWRNRIKLHGSFTNQTIDLKELFLLKKYSDTLESKKGEYPKKGDLYDSLKFGPFVDYFIYTTRVADHPDKSGYDTLLYRYPGMRLEQNDWYVAVTDYYSLSDNTRLMAGAHYIRSNMLNTRRVVTGVFGHATRFHHAELGNYYYATSLGKYGVFQSAPFIKWTSGRLAVQGVCSIGKAVQRSAGADGLSRAVQRSGEATVSYATSILRISTTSCLGTKAFMNEAEGQVLHNVAIPHRFGQSMLLEVYPFSIPATLYTLGTVRWYAQYRSLVLMGGLFYSW